MTELSPVAAPPESHAGRRDRCPACQHPAGSERITRGAHMWPFNKPRLLRCCHVTDHGPAVDLGHDIEVCNCADDWHTAG